MPCYNLILVSVKTGVKITTTTNKQTNKHKSYREIDCFAGSLVSNEIYVLLNPCNLRSWHMKSVFKVVGSNREAHLTWVNYGAWFYRRLFAFVADISALFTCVILASWNVCWFDVLLRCYDAFTKLCFELNTNNINTEKYRL